MTLQVPNLVQGIGMRGVIGRLSDRVHPRWIPWTLALALIGLALWVTRQPLLDRLALLQDQDAIQETVSHLGPWGPLALASGQFLQVIVSFIPGHLLMVAGGYLYGFAGGFSLNLLTTVAASQVAFVLARKAGRPLVARLAGPKVVARVDDLAEGHGVLLLVVCFMIPFVPGDTLNLAAGLSAMPSRRFLVANFAGRLPGALVMTLVGSHGLAFSPTTWVVAGLLLTVLIGGCSLAHRALTGTPHLAAK